LFTLRRLLVFLIISLTFFAACAAPAGSVTPTSLILPTATIARPALTATPTRAFETGEYRNLFKEYLGKSDAEIQGKLDSAWNQLFYGADGTGAREDGQRIYYPVGSDMAYIEDIGDSDVRTEGMSYGMMIAVQLDKKEEFDRLWKWAKTYMYQAGNPYKGYFAWHCSTDGNQLDSNPASDGEEWFVMALLFASGRWGDGTGIFDYRAQAQDILDTMLHTEDQNSSDLATNMFDAKTKEVVFVPRLGSLSNYTDPSYHLPAYYELWARWARHDNQFWAEAAQASREYFKKAANSQTGLMPDFTSFDGVPHDDAKFRFDAWRTLSNVAVDYAWFAADPWQVEQSNRMLGFLASQGMSSYSNQFSLEGEPLSKDHSPGLAAMASVGALAATPEKGKPFVQVLWDTDIPPGKWRYYDGMLYMLALLHVSGNFQIYTPALEMPRQYESKWDKILASHLEPLSARLDLTL